MDLSSTLNANDTLVEGLVSLSKGFDIVKDLCWHVVGFVKVDTSDQYRKECKREILTEDYIPIKKNPTQSPSLLILLLDKDLTLNFMRKLWFLMFLFSLDRTL